MRLKLVLLTALCLIFAFSLAAQQPEMSEEQKKMMEAYMKAGTPGDHHKALDAMVGTWHSELRFWPAPGAPPEESTGVSKNEWILGGRYIEQRFKGTAMGQPFEGVGYTGYDNMRNRYFGSWMDSMSTGMMTTTGKSAEGGKVWVFEGEMDDPMTGKAYPVKQKITVNSPDKHVFEMWSPGPDGKMFRSMEIVYTRKK